MERMFWERLHDHNIPPECIYNGEQLGLFFNKVLNMMMYIDKDHQKPTKGVKAMKSKDGVSITICTSCTGKNRFPWRSRARLSNQCAFDLLYTSLKFADLVGGWHFGAHLVMSAYQVYTV
jgi:hypothetical protein